MPQEAFEQGKFAWREGDRASRDRDLTHRLIERDRSVHELGRASGSVPAPAPKCPQPRGELLVGEWLDQVVIGSRIQASHAIVDRVAGREHQDGNR